VSSGGSGSRSDSSVDGRGGLVVVMAVGLCEAYC